MRQDLFFAPRGRARLFEACLLRAQLQAIVGGQMWNDLAKQAELFRRATRQNTALAGDFHPRQFHMRRLRQRSQPRLREWNWKRRAINETVARNGWLARILRKKRRGANSVGACGVWNGRRQMNRHA